MKLLFVTSTLSSGGTERVISLLANELAKRQHYVEIICLNRHDVFYPINEDVNVVFAEEEAGTSSIGKKMIWLRKYHFDYLGLIWRLKLQKKTILMKKRKSFFEWFYDMFLKASCEDAAEECIAEIMKEAENKK